MIDDLISRQVAIDVEGIDEQIRCEMCRNPKHTDRGCDGNCKYDERLYERIMQIFDERIKPLPSTQTERWDTCFDCPLSHGCPVINGCTNEQAMQYAGDIPDNCPLNKLERKGKWIYYDPNGFKCSRCGRYLEIECGDVKMNFCPHCGNYNGDEHNE